MDETDYKDSPFDTMSEGWWAAVMEDDKCQPNDVNKAKAESTAQGKRQNDENDWAYVEVMLKEECLITGTVVDYNRGGLLICNEKFQGFVPISHLDAMPALEEVETREETLKEYIGSRLRLKVIECDQNRGRIVLSERAAQTEPGVRQKLLNSLKIGDQVTGKVTNITDFGVFVDLGGIEGLVHISELSWGRVQHPKDHLELCQDISVLILKVDEEKSRVSLSLKRLSQNPWEEISQRYPSGTVLSGMITQIVNYGAFAQLEGGVEGLIHISEMGLLGNKSPEEYLEQGQQVDVEVVSVDPSRQRMSLRLIQ